VSEGTSVVVEVCPRACPMQMLRRRARKGEGLCLGRA
jgi:hypothetical protein